MAEQHLVANAGYVPPAIVVPDVRWQGQVRGDIAGLVPYFAHFDVGVRKDHSSQMLVNVVRKKPRGDVRQHVQDGHQRGSESAGQCVVVLCGRVMGPGVDGL